MSSFRVFAFWGVCITVITVPCQLSSCIFVKVCIVMIPIVVWVSATCHGLGFLGIQGQGHTPISEKLLLWSAMKSFARTRKTERGYLGCWCSWNPSALSFTVFWDASCVGWNMSYSKPTSTSMTLNKYHTKICNNDRDLQWHRWTILSVGFPVQRALVCRGVSTF